MKEQPGRLGWKLKGGTGALLLSMLLLSALSFAVAQSNRDRPPLTLSKVVLSEPAVAGGTLTYLLILTNTGQVSLTEVIVTDTTPDQTTVFGAAGPPGWWLTTTSGQGQPGQVVWRAENPLPPGEVVTLRLDIRVVPDAAGPIVSDEYEARAAGWAGPVTGPPVLTEVIAPTPTWTLPPLPTERPTETMTATPTNIPKITPTAAATAPPAVKQKQVQTPTQIPAPSSLPVSSTQETDVAVGNGTMISIGVVILVIGLVVVFFVVRRKQRT